MGDGTESIKSSELTEEQIKYKKKVEKIFKENNWKLDMINCVSVDFDENNELKAIS